MLTDRPTDKKQTNERTKLHQCQKHLSYDVFKLESGNKNVDGQTDGRRTPQSNRRVGYTQPA